MRLVMVGSRVNTGVMQKERRREVLQEAVNSYL